MSRTFFGRIENTNALKDTKYDTLKRYFTYTFQSLFSMY